MSLQAYRSLAPVLEERLTALRELRERDAVEVDAVRRIARRRMGRAWGGAAALLTGLTAFVAGLASLPASYPGDHELQLWATGLLFAAPLVGLCAMVAGRIWSRGWLAWALDAPPRLTGDVTADLAAVEAADPLRASREVAMRWERASVAWPLAAVSILAPLTIHGIAWSFFNLPTGEISTRSLADFGVWISLSALIVGHAHIAVLVGAVRWACRLRATPTQYLRLDLHKHWGPTLLIAVGIACIPGIVLLGIPPLLVAVTGVVFLPLTFARAARVVSDERMVLEAV
jgi:hypothetical protein